jgi:hypothetical protein
LKKEKIKMRKRTISRKNESMGEVCNLDLYFLALAPKEIILY